MLTFIALLKARSPVVAGALLVKSLRSCGSQLGVGKRRPSAGSTEFWHRCGLNRAESGDFLDLCFRFE